MIVNKIMESVSREREAIDKITPEVIARSQSAIDLIINCKGRIVFTGIGKSGYIGRKLAATYSSLGIPAFFIHATESVHGDMGMIMNEDIVWLISNSGKTEEILVMLEHLKNRNVKSIGMCSDEQSLLATLASVSIIYPKVKEADEYNLAPTSSTTVALVLGESIACAVSQEKKFTKQDFYRFHPGGSLGSSVK